MFIIKKRRREEKADFMRWAAVYYKIGESKVVQARLDFGTTGRSDTNSLASRDGNHQNLPPRKTPPADTQPKGAERGGVEERRTGTRGD